MSVNIEGSETQTERQSTSSQGTTILTESTENVITTDPPEELGQAGDELQGVEETLKTPEGNQEETKVEGTTEESGNVKENSLDVDTASELQKPLSEGLKSEDGGVLTENLEREIEQADENQVSEAEGEAEVQQPAEEEEAVKLEGDAKEEDLTEGEKMLRDIDSSKVIEETDTELDYNEELETQHSRITLHPEELPEIRGLAELEYQSPEESQREVTFDNIQLSKRRSVRASFAYKMLQEGETSEKRRKAKIIETAKGEKVTVIEEEEEEVVKADRTLSTREELYAIHEELYSSIVYIRAKNRYLQRKCADFFKKRRMEHALKEEGDIHSDALVKYEKKLDRLADFLDVYVKETERVRIEMEALQKERDDKFQERDIGCNKRAARQREIGIGLINTKTGKEIPDKVVDQLIRRQTTAAKQISQLRLKFITFRNEIAEKTAELKSLDNIGDDLSLMDYEQLKIENRAHSDKLEEKEEELTKLRVKCRNAVQIMAHVREKSAALDADMDVLKEEFEEVHFQYIEIRERLNFCKTERDIIRNKTMKLKAESGLLTKPKLLQDMETSMQEVELYEKTLQRVKNEYTEKTQKIRNLRKNIAYEIVMNKKQPKEKKKKTVAKFFQVRPTLIAPKLPTSYFDRMVANSSSVILEMANKK